MEATAAGEMEDGKRRTAVVAGILLVSGGVLL